MTQLTLKNLEICFNTAIKENAMFVGVAVVIGEQKTPEIIINKLENFESKLAYYKNAYNEDLTLKANQNIKIVGFSHGDVASTIVSDLLP